jgi:hypothetical protein
MQKLLLTLGLMLSFSAGLYGCADDIDARGSKVDTDTDTGADEGAAGAAGGGAVEDDDECAAACDNDECVAACSD